MYTTYLETYTHRSWFSLPFFIQLWHPKKQVLIARGQTQTIAVQKNHLPKVNHPAFTMSTSGVLVNQHGKRSREPELENSSVGSSDIHTDLSTSPLPASAAHPTLNELPSQSSKILHLDLESESESGVRSITATPTAQMLCSLAGHRQTLSFASYEEYEIHYNKSHGKHWRSLELNLRFKKSSQVDERTTVETNSQGRAYL